MMDHLANTAAALDLPFGKREMTYNSRLAQELGKWAESQDKGREFHQAVFRAYFADGWNISDINVLVRIGESIGLNQESLRTVILSRSFKAAVDADWSRSHQLGVTAVPTFRINKQHLVGAQPYRILEQFLESHNVTRRNVA
jgi:predicted DsbA family dithiol-disulfide isomerase